MPIFGRSKAQAYDPALGVAPPPSVKDRIINQISANLLGYSPIAAKRQQALQGAQSGFMTNLMDQLQPGYAAGPDISVGEGGNAADYQYQAPVRTRDPLSINSPELPALAARAQALGVPISNVLDILKAQQPDVAYDRGYGYNRKTGAPVGAFHADVGEGRMAILGPDGNPTRIQNIDGYTRSLAEAEAAKTGAQEGAKAAFVYGNARNQARGSAEGSAPYDFINVPGPNGQPMTISKAQAAGGMFEGQTPADAAYGNDIAKAAATQFQGLQTAGQNATKKIATYQQLGKLLQDVDGGRLTPAGTEIASTLNSIGFKVDKNLGNKQAAEALMNQLVLDANGGSLGPGVSNADVQFLAKTGPNLTQSAEGRQKLMTYAIASEQRKQSVAQKARAWQQRFGRIDKPDATGKTFYDYLDAWATKNPLVQQ